MKARSRNALDLEQMLLFASRTASPPWSAFSPGERGTVIELLAELLAPRLHEPAPHPEDRDDER